jgi:mono/diheme cytochrome c family protein
MTSSVLSMEVMTAKLPSTQRQDMTGHRNSASMVAAVLLALAGCSREPEPLRLRPDDQAVVAAGQRVYAMHCAACHGAKLEGQPNWREHDASGRLPAPPHDPSGHTWHHPEEVLFRITKFGVAKAANLPGHDSAMPAYEGVLSDADIVAVLSFIKAGWPSEIRRQNDEVTAAAAGR